MTSLERVSLALQHKEPDHVPAYPLINSISRTYMGIDYPTWSKDADLCVDSILKATDDGGVDVICTLQDLSVEAADFGQPLDYPPEEAAHPAKDQHMLNDEEDYYKIERVNPRKTERMSKQIHICDRLVKERGKEMPIVSFVYGPLGTLSMMRGAQDLFLDCLESPEALHHGLEVVTDTLLEYCKAIVETGVHAVMFDTLFASKSIMSKDMWREFEGPYIKRMADYVHSQGVMVMIHNCGDGIYFDAQIEAMQPEAISFLYPPDDCADFVEAKAKYGDKTTLIGAVEPSWLMFASRDDVVKKCEEQMREMGKNGGFILATGCEYPSGMSPDYAKLMVKVAQTSGKYE